MTKSTTAHYPPLTTHRTDKISGDPLRALWGTLEALWDTLGTLECHAFSGDTPDKRKTLWREETP